jgi:hypothetical protein
MPSVMRRLDEALADIVALRVRAAELEIKAKQAETLSAELMRMVDTLRSERDSWRAASGR